METTRKQVGDVIVVGVAAGRLGPTNAKDLDRQLTDLLGPDMKVVIDLGRVESIDGSGCGANPFLEPAADPPRGTHESMRNLSVGAAALPTGRHAQADGSLQHRRRGGEGIPIVTRRQGPVSPTSSLPPDPTSLYHTKKEWIQ